MGARFFRLACQGDGSCPYPPVCYASGGIHMWHVSSYLYYNYAVSSGVARGGSEGRGLRATPFGGGTLLIKK